MSKIRYRNRYIFSLVFLIFFALLIHGPVIAKEDTHTTGSEVSDDHGAEHSGDRSGDLLDLLYRFMNFTLLVIILFVVIKKTPIKDIFAVRSEEIRQKLEDLKREKAEAESRYREIEKQLEDFANKRNDIIEEYKNEGLAEKEKIIAEAKEKVNQIIEQSELTIEQEIQSAKKRLKQDVVEIAVQRAQEIIAKEMNEKDQDDLINDFIERMGKGN